MTEAGADVLVAHLGLTTKGTIGATTALTLDESIRRVQEIHDAAKAVREDVLVICHGGPVAEPDDVNYVLENSRGIVGFFGASSVERLPTEREITEQVKSFNVLHLSLNLGPMNGVSERPSCLSDPVGHTRGRMVGTAGSRSRSGACRGGIAAGEILRPSYLVRAL